MHEEEVEAHQDDVEQREDEAALEDAGLLGQLGLAD